MDDRVKKIAIGVCCFLGVMVILCFVLWIIISNDDDSIDSGYDAALDKLASSGVEPGNTGEDKSIDDKNTTGSTTEKGSTADKGSTTDNGNTETPDTKPTETPKPTPAADPTKAPKPTETPKPTEAAKPTSKPTAVPTKAPTASPTPRPSKAPTLKVVYGDGAYDISANDLDVTGGYTIVIDPAHQAIADTEPEPVGPGATETRRKQSWGATGVVTGASEYAYNLYMAQKLRKILMAKGYDVIMTRETNDVNISESDRAKFANESGADIVIHLHANADDRTDMNGAMCFAPSKNNPYLDKKLVTKCNELSSILLEEIKNSAGCRNYGIVTRDNLTALNYTTIPAVDLEIGYMSNAKEDKLLQDQEYQNKIIMGIALGIDSYFGY